MGRDRVALGISDHAGWAVAVAWATTGSVVDSRRIALKDGELPALPHHVQGKRLPIDEAVEIVARVERSAREHAAARLAEVEAALGSPVSTIALRAIPPMPATTAERIRDYWANSRADGVMYREALAGAARDCGMTVHWFHAAQVFDAAGEYGFAGIEAAARARFAPPWNKDHRLALAAAVLAMQRECEGAEP